MRTAFVTGATGFLGASLAPRLRDAGFALRCLVRPGSDARNLDGVPHQRIEGDLDDAAALRRGCEGAEAVVHLAALVSFARRDRARAFRVQVEGTRRVARAAREAGAARLLHLSSVAAVGASTDGRAIDEDADWNLGPLDVAYCTSKREAELALVAERALGLDVVTVCPVTLFGPGDRRGAAGGPLVSAARGLLRARPPGGLEIADVRDVADACVAALERGRSGARYVLGGHRLTGSALVEALCDAVGRRPPRLGVPAALLRVAAAAAGPLERAVPLPTALCADVLRLAGLFFWFDDGRARRELGYVNRPLDETLADAVAELRTTGRI